MELLCVIFCFDERFQSNLEVGFDWNTTRYTNFTLKCRMAISKFIMVNADTTTKEYAE
ncbi:MAG: hypothetical protein HN778_08010 [Prolixibacteraceae bacterium]|nr:hypothetical protein [Prolixibacteraceae bacterium]MBT6999256.1 hypothetical protein [Prolixibacteraceae bacterium]MBT7394761.1 hypothetical protein [Prolixibacteraceae bacterium]